MEGPDRRAHDPAMPCPDQDCEALVLAHVGLAKLLARRYARGGREELEELEQVAALGLVQAARRFDGSRGTAFSSFAVPTIIGELRRHFRTTSWVAHVPRRLQEAHLQARRTEQAMTAERRRLPGAVELASRLGWTLDELLEARAAAAALAPVSLEAPMGDDEDAPALVDRLGADDPGFRDAEIRDELDQALSDLDPPAGAAVRLRLTEELSCREIADRLDVSPSYASKLINRALGRLEATLTFETA